MEVIKPNLNSNSNTTYCSSFKKDIYNLKKISGSMAFKLLVKNKKINFVKLFQAKYFNNNNTFSKNKRCLRNLNTQNNYQNTSSNNETKQIKTVRKIEEIKKKKKYREKKRYKSISINTDINNFFRDNKKNKDNIEKNCNNAYKLFGDNYLADLILSPSQSITGSLSRQLTSNLYKNKINTNNNNIKKTNLSMTNRTKNGGFNRGNNKNNKINKRNINLNINLNTNTDRPHKTITKHTSNTSIPTPRRREFSKDYGSVVTKESSLAIGIEGGTNKKKGGETIGNKKINNSNNNTNTSNNNKIDNNNLFEKLENVKERANELFCKYSILVENLEKKLNMFEKQNKEMKKENKNERKETNENKKGNNQKYNKKIIYQIENENNNYFDYICGYMNNKINNNKKKITEKHSFITYSNNLNNINNGKFISRNPNYYHMRNKSHG